MWDEVNYCIIKLFYNYIVTVLFYQIEDREQSFQAEIGWCDFSLCSKTWRKKTDSLIKKQLQYKGKIVKQKERILFYQ